MQYSPQLSRTELVELAIEQYFGNVDAKNMEAVLDCFNEEALFTVQTAFTCHAGKPAIRQMFSGFFASYAEIIHKDFVCTVDEKNGRISASFVAELKAPDGAITRFYNTNFWRVRNARFQEVYVYFSGANVLV